MDGGEAGKEGSEKRVGCPQTSFPTGEINSLQVITLVTLEKGFTLLVCKKGEQGL